MTTDLKNAVASLGISLSVTADEIRSHFGQDAECIQKVNMETYKFLSVLLVSCEEAERLGFFENKAVLILLKEELKNFMQTNDFASAELFVKHGTDGKFLKRFADGKALLEEILKG